jgi:hypothetical protein
VLFLAEAALGEEHSIVRDDPSLVSPPKGGSCDSPGPAWALLQLRKVRVCLLLSRPMSHLQPADGHALQ